VIGRSKEYSDEEILNHLEPTIAEWFRKKYGFFTPPQKHAIIEIARRRNILICSPTGTGKTMAGFLAIIDYLFKLSLRGELEDKVYCLYISPLKALGNDIQKNLKEPLREISELAKKKGIELNIRVGVRTGDTPQNERQKMLREPPHILITTPETASIILNAPKFREHLRALEFVIVDEIHDVADNKRGAHLSITLERLQHLCEKEFTRVGMSATIHPVEEVARFLIGVEERGCIIADVAFEKKIELRVETPSSDILGDPEITEKMYKRIKELVESHRGVLIFTNTRSGAERVAYHLSKLLKDEVGAHHSSLSREIRLSVEEALKEGKLKAVACSSSLELGIDIGHIELCILVGSPKSAIRLLQRVGRSGHGIHETAKGVIIAMDRDDLIECLVLSDCALKKKLDRIQIVGPALDVLAQQIVGMALEKRWSVEEAYEVVRKAYPYRNLRKEDFLNVLRYLSGKYEHLEERKVYPKVWFDEEEGVFGRRKSSRMIYMTHVGTIPSEVSIDVYLKEPKRWIGKIDEPFLERLSKGDIFVLGGNTYRFLSSSDTRIYVEKVEGTPTIPSWIGEMLPLSFDSACEVGEFRRKAEEMLKRGEFRIESDVLSGDAKRCIEDYFREQISFCGMIPHRKRIIVESYEEDGIYNIIVHAIFGRRVIDAISRALAYLISRNYRTNVSVTISDNGFILRCTKRVPLEEILSLRSSELRGVLRRAIRNTELFLRRFRHCANRALMVLRSYRGHQIRIGKQQRSSEFILSSAERIEGFPVVEETYREILEEVMDVKNAERVLEEIENGEIEVVFLKDVIYPSPFAHNLVALGLSDVVLMESRRELLLEMHRKVMEYIEANS
jgi:ATP-dependent Lhr-like helicase